MQCAYADTGKLSKFFNLQSNIFTSAINIHCDAASESMLFYNIFSLLVKGGSVRYLCFKHFLVSLIPHNTFRIIHILYLILCGINSIICAKVLILTMIGVDNNDNLQRKSIRMGSIYSFGK